MTICWLNGQIVPKEQATVSIFDHGLLYGDGIFEGIRFYHGRIFRLQAHLDRLWDSANALGLNIPYSLEELSQALEQVVDAYDGEDGYIRLVVTRGEGRLGVNPNSCTRPTVFIIAEQLELIAEEKRRKGASVIIAATRRMSAASIDPRIKSLNYLNNILAHMEAKHAGTDEAIMLNQAGFVAEGSTDNLFVIKNGILKTPPAIDGALEGITRGVVLDIARENNLSVNECSLGIYDLYTADECFLTGTGMELLAVREIDGRAIASCPGPVFEKINGWFQELIRQESGVMSV